MHPSKANDFSAVIAAAAQRVMQRCDELAACTERPCEITRTFCSPAMQEANQRVRRWMEAAGLHCGLDPATNLIGRRPGNAKTARTLLIGSHLDSVVNAGRYDGVLGVMMGIALAEIANETLAKLPFTLDVIAFCEEEGVRFQTPYIGSRAIAGLWNDDLLARRDAQGSTLGDVLRSFGGDPQRIAEAAYNPRQVVAYLEAHIEQGPMLELQGLPVGVVTGIAGQTRAALVFHGRAGHAGTVPMNARRDALAAAAQWISDVERIGHCRAGLVATVGCLEVKPGVVNVIPGEAHVRLDVRHLDDSLRDAAVAEILQSAQTISQSRGITATVERIQHEPAVQCDEQCIDALEKAVAESSQRSFRLPSGAGHDAVMMGKRFPAGMLFLRCPGGISHHPDESVAEADVGVGLEVLWRAVIKFAEEEARE